jgi:hypothetical protein
MGSFYYNPQATDRSGEFWARGIETAGASLSAAIEGAAAAHKKNKAYAALADVLGLDPKHSTERDVQAAMLKDQILTARQERSRKLAGQAALARLVPAIRQNMMPAAAVNVRPVWQEPTEEELPGLPGVTLGTPTPGLSAREATLKALSDYPAALQTQTGQAALEKMLEGLTAQPKAAVSMGTERTSGRAMWLDPSGRLQFAPAAPGPEKPKAAYTDPTKPPTDKPPTGFVWRFNGYHWEQTAKPLGVEFVIDPKTGKYVINQEQGGGALEVDADPLGALIKEIQNRKK